MHTHRTLATRRRPLVAVAVALALSAGCGGGESGDGGTGTDGGGDVPSTETTGGDGGSECRTELVEDEYGFEVEIEVCD